MDKKQRKRIPPTSREAEWEKGAKEARMLTDQLLKADPSRNVSDPTLPIYVFFAQVRLEQIQLAFEDGDDGGLFEALRLCANHRMAMPDWVAINFIRRYDQVLNCHLKSWDDAFGAPFAKGRHLSAARKKRRLGPQVWQEVQTAHDEGGRAIDEQLFEEVGRKLGIGKTLAAEYYYSFKAKLQGDFYTLVTKAVLGEEPFHPEKKEISRKDPG